MPSTFEFKVPIRKNTNWGNLLVETLRQSFGKLSEQLENVTVKSELKDLKESLTSSIDVIKTTACDALQIAQSNTKDISALKDELCAEFSGKINEVKEQCAILKAENMILINTCESLQQQSDDHEIYSRKNNLIFKGISESKNETDEQSEHEIRAFLKNNLNIDNNVVNNMKFSACHRFGQHYNDNKSNGRAIIVRLMNRNDRNRVWDERAKLRNTNFYINENYPRNVGYNRRKLQPNYSFAKKMEHYEKRVSLKSDRLIIDRKTYTVNNIESLPEDIHPKNLCTKNNEHAIISGGLFSEHSYLSNYSQCSLKYDSVKYATLEHAYQHVRAKHFKDHAAAAKILRLKQSESVIRSATITRLNGGEFVRT